MGIPAKAMPSDTIHIRTSAGVRSGPPQFAQGRWRGRAGRRRADGVSFVQYTMFRMPGWLTHLRTDSDRFRGLWGAVPSANPWKPAASAAAVLSVDGPRQRLFAATELVSEASVTATSSSDWRSIRAGRRNLFRSSAGPDLLGGTDIVLGVNSYVTNVNCGGVGYSQRVDIPEVLSWIQSWF